MSNVLIGDLEGVQKTGGKGCLLKASSLWLSGSLHFDFKLAQVFRGIRLGSQAIAKGGQQVQQNPVLGLHKAR